MRETETSIIKRIKTDVKWEGWKEQVNSQITSGLYRKLRLIIRRLKKMRRRARQILLFLHFSGFDNK